MVKVRITPDRFSTSCNVIEYLSILAGDQSTAVKILPRFVVGEDDNYIIGVEHDDEGDIKEYTNIEPALKALFSLTPKRLEKLGKELVEAAKNIVNPTKDGD